jgi:thiol-disulfide isomerase/thioredoxin
MQVFALLSASILVATFGLALVAKARDLRDFRDSLSSFGFPPGVYNLIVIVTLAAEALAIVALLAMPLRWAGIICLVLLVAFSVAAALAMLRGRKPQCQCFGNLTSGSIGMSTILRNAALAACAVVLLTEGRSLLGVVRPMGAQTMIISFMAIGIAGLLALVFDQLRRYGEVLHTLDALGIDTVTRMQRRGPKPGESLPELTVLDLDNQRVMLTDKTRSLACKSVVLLSTTCGHCEALVPALERAAARGIPGIVIVQGRDTATLDPLYSLHNSRWPVLFAEQSDLITHFHVAGFPGLVPIDEQGNVEGGTLLGRQSIEVFLERQLGALGPGMERKSRHDLNARQNARPAEPQGTAI